MYKVDAGHDIRPINFGDLGILGLASDFNACNPSCVPTFMDDLVGSGKVKNNLLGI